MYQVYEKVRECTTVRMASTTGLYGTAVPRALPMSPVRALRRTGEWRPFFEQSRSHPLTEQLPSVRTSWRPDTEQLLPSVEGRTGDAHFLDVRDKQVWHYRKQEMDTTSCFPHARML